MVRSTVVIPNWNGKEYLSACLDSLRRQKECTPAVIVVDNGSQDESVPFLKEYYPEVQVIAFSENTGFCKAVNAGIRAAKTEYVILLNNDTTAEPYFIKNLEESMDKSERIFSVSAKMVSMQNPQMIDDAGDYYCALGWAYAEGKGKKDSPVYAKRKRIFASCAGAAIYRREIFDKIGYFDEQHFAYLEDIDIGYRARIYGYVNMYEPTALVYHAGSATSGSKYNEFKVNLSSRNSVYIIRKNMPFLQSIINLPFLVIGFTVKMLFFAKKGYGRIYIKGLFQGLSLSRSAKGREKKVPFRISHLKNYCMIQWELWANMVRRFLGGK